MRKILLTSVCLLVLHMDLHAQCTPLPVTHTSGTQQVGGTSVTVTSQNASAISSGCPNGTAVAGPYWIGANAAVSSYTFTFSPSIALLEFDYRDINNYPTGAEELSFIINGNFYAIPDAGTSIGCYPLGVLVGGKLQAEPNSIGAGNTVTVAENISSITIVNEYIDGTPGGVIFALRVCAITCTTDAGILSGGPFNLCGNVPVTFPAATGVVLDNNDILRYILFSDPADTLGSIIATSNSPTFSFNPATMQPNVTYYIAAMAGNNLNGNVDTNDPCLDISNAVQVVWHPLPTVSFSSTNPDICAGDCAYVEATFTGTAPFTLTYTSPATGTVTQTFSGNTETFLVCTPPGSTPGSLAVQATKVVDAWCTCQ